MGEGEDMVGSGLRRWRYFVSVQVIVALVTVLLLGPQPVAADDTSEVLTQRALVDGRYAMVASA